MKHFSSSKTIVPIWQNTFERALKDLVSHFHKHADFSPKYDLTG